MIEFIMSLCLEGVMASFDKLPKLVAKILLLLASGACLLAGGAVSYGIFRVLLNGDFIVAVGLFVPFAIFFSLLLKCFLLFWHLEHAVNPVFDLWCQFIFNSAMLLFFLALFLLILADTINPVENLPLWRRGVIFLILLVGLVEYLIKVSGNLKKIWGIN